MSTVEKALHIDIPVMLGEFKVAFNVAALAFEGDVPASIFHLQLITKNVVDWNTKAESRRGVSYDRRPRDAARPDVQCRPHGFDRQSVQGTCSGSHETRGASR